MEEKIGTTGHLLGLPLKINIVDSWEVTLDGQAPIYVLRQDNEDIPEFLKRVGISVIKPNPNPVE